MEEQDLIVQSWNYIEYWLDNETRDINSKSLARGTKEEILKDFQEELTIKLPADLCQSYLIHNGFREKVGLVHGGELLALHEIKKTFFSLVRKKQLFDWDRNMLPIVAFNEVDFLCQHVKDGHIYWIGIDSDENTIKSQKITDSFTDFLSELANDLKEGNGCMGEMLGK